jgi:hypothetical protein
VYKFEGLGQGLQFTNIVFFELGIVKGVEVIESPNRMTLLEEPLTNMRADEARTASDKEIHESGPKMEARR